MRACREGVPFHSKVGLVIDAIRTFKPLAGTKTHILVDAWYTCHSLWTAVLQRNFVITGGLRAALAASGQTGAPIGDASRYQHHAHYHRLLKWLQLKLETGHNISEIENLLAA